MFQKALLTLDRSPFSAAAIARVADVAQLLRCLILF